MEKGFSYNELSTLFLSLLMFRFLFYLIYSFLSTKKLLGSCSTLLSHMFLISERSDEIIPQTLTDAQSVASQNKQLNLFAIYEGIHTCLYHLKLDSQRDSTLLMLISSCLCVH